MLKIGILKEITCDERRVAATPDTVTKMLANGMQVFVEQGAGQGAYLTDDDFQKAGAVIVKTQDLLLQQANIMLHVQNPLLSNQANPAWLNACQEKSILIAPLYPLEHREMLLKINAQKKLTTFALDLLPRIARAQSMDILSSMSNIAGYKSVILAAEYLNKIFPMMTTAAGTLLPAKIMVIGVGVAGLQAIATARRLGGVVLACDTRPETEQQVHSLGAQFFQLTKGDEQASIMQNSSSADVIISSALIPGKPAPLLITRAMLKKMKPGSVIVDLAVERGGNCECTQIGKIVVEENVTIIGLPNLASTMPIHASQLLANNMWSFLNYIAPQIKNESFDLSDDIIANCLITHNGNILPSALA